MFFSFIVSLLEAYLVGWRWPVFIVAYQYLSFKWHSRTETPKNHFHFCVLICREHKAVNKYGCVVFEIRREGSEIQDRKTTESEEDNILIALGQHDAVAIPHFSYELVFFSSIFLI